MIFFIEALYHFLAVVFKTLAQHSGIGLFVRLRQLSLTGGIHIRPGKNCSAGAPAISPAAQSALAE